MSDQRRDALFPESDQLHLIQLWTRRAIAERRDTDSATVDPGGPESRSMVERTDSQRWRLVPEGVELYEWQKQCLAKWLPEARGTVKVATGGGKTLFALAAAERLQNERDPDLRLVVVVPTIPLMHQWFDELRQSNVPGALIGLMGGGRELPSPRDVRILICVINSARERLPRYVEQGQWGPHMLLVVDECHRASADQARKIFDSRPRYTLGLSATPEPEGLDESLPSDDAYAAGVVGQNLGPIIFDFTLRDSLKAGLLTPFEVWHVGLPLTPSETLEHAGMSRDISELRKQLQTSHRRAKTRLSFLAWCQAQASRRGPYAGTANRFIGLSNLRKDLLYRAEARTEAVLALLQEGLADPESRTIVFHERIAEIEAAYLAAEKRGLPVVLEHSNLPEGLRAEAIDAFRRGVARVIVSAKSLIEGFNVPSADFGIIAASSGSVRQRIQSLGRMLRRKQSGRTARIVVLYVADTEDEALYEKADWENIVGAERNRYCRWRRVEGQAWSAGLAEQPGPPRAYRPPCTQLNVNLLAIGDPYPAQTGGRELHVDAAGNLRTESGTLVLAAGDLIDAIITTSRNRRANVNSCGHVVARAGGSGPNVGWVFLGTLTLPEEQGGDATVTYLVKQVAGQRRIARKDPGGKVTFARGPENGTPPQAAEARDTLLEWLHDVERSGGRKVTSLYWDGESSYWVEIGSKRIVFGKPLAALDFGG